MMTYNNMDTGLRAHQVSHMCSNTPIHAAKHQASLVSIGVQVSLAARTTVMVFLHPQACPPAGQPFPVQYFSKDQLTICCQSWPSLMRLQASCKQTYHEGEGCSGHLTVEHARFGLDPSSLSLRWPQVMRRSEMVQEKTKHEAYCDGHLTQSCNGCIESQLRLL